VPVRSPSAEKRIALSRESAMHVFAYLCMFMHVGEAMQPDLLLRQRQTLIQDRLRQSGRVLAADLAQEFSVSEDTIRRDLRELAAAGLCARVYGGALSVTPGGTFARRMGEAPERKAALALAALAFIKPGATVFFDAGSTNMAIARSLPDDLVL